MSHVVTRPREPFLAVDGKIRVHQVPAARDNLVWLVECTATGETAVVDGPGAKEALAYAEAHGLELGVVLNTHTHHDHIGVNMDLARRGLLDGMRVVGCGARASEIPGLTEPVGDGDTVRVGEVEGQVWLTEGHIDGHLSFVFVGEQGDGVVFCGDTLFTGGCGYLFDGPPEKMHHSLQRLASLPDDTRVCCAHEYTEDNLRFAWSIDWENAGLSQRIREVWAVRADGGCAVPSTIGEEKATNPFLRGRPLVRALCEAAPDADLSSPAAIFAAARRLKNGGAHKSLTDDDLPL
ncbi:MAG: hydroxyacylglutathione hydrolase [Deltaproteobacteria bacterium]|nr:MAG: hydroxyacylglutathione hydrolase [Deltaproteobacteria bacterium]